jgi:uncharacterized membrane protein YczE
VAKTRAKNTPAQRQRKDRRPPPRLVTVAVGALIGFVFGSLMWLITGLQGGVRVWAYLAITTAMIGCGVSAAFGAAGARKRGERISPKVRLPFRRRP